MTEKRFRVLWTAAAAGDLRRIVLRIADEGSPGNADRLLKRLRSRAAALQSHPQRGRVVPELKDQGVSLYREVVVPPWRVLYRVADARVLVLAVVDARRNLEDLLLERFLD